MNSPVRREFLLLPQPPQIFSVKGFEALFPCTGTLGCVVCLTPQLFLTVYPQAKVGPPAPPAVALPLLPATALHESSVPQLLSLPLLSVSMSASSLTPCQTSIHFDFLAVLFIFCFKFVVVLLLVVQGGKLYLPMPPL